MLQVKKPLIVLEEAQNLSHDVLETLRLLSNLETNTHKLLHILLVGQPELLEDAWARQASAVKSTSSVALPFVASR